MNALIQNLNISASQEEAAINEQWGDFPSKCTVEGNANGLMIRTPFKVLPPGTMVLANNNDSSVNVQAYHLSVEDGNPDCIEVDVQAAAPETPITAWGCLYIQIIVPI